MVRKRGITGNAVEPLQSLQELIEVNPAFLARMGTSVFPTAAEKLQKIQPAGSAPKAKSYIREWDECSCCWRGGEIILLAMRKVCWDAGTGHYHSFFFARLSLSHIVSLWDISPGDG